MTLQYHNPNFNQSILFTIKNCEPGARVSLGAPSGDVSVFITFGIPTINFKHTFSVFFSYFKLPTLSDTLGWTGNSSHSHSLQNLVVISKTTVQAQQAVLQKSWLPGCCHGNQMQMNPMAANPRFSRLPCSTWTLPGKRKTGRQKATWHQTVKAELSEVTPTWGEALYM